MKIKKLYEQDETHLCRVETECEKYEPEFESMLDHFFNGFNLANAELLEYIEGENVKGISLIIDVFLMDLNSKYLLQITNFVKFIEKYGKYIFIPSEPETGNDGRMGIQTDFLFKDLRRMLPKLKVMVDTKKYNL